MIVAQYIILKTLFSEIPELTKLPLPFSTQEIFGNDYEEFATFEQWVTHQNKFEYLQEVTITRKLPKETIQIIVQHWTNYSNKLYNEIVPFPHDI